MALLAAVGGADIAAMTGFLLGAAARRTPVLLDGVVSCAARSWRSGSSFRAREWWLAGHRSTEPAATAALERLGLEPIVDYGLRLGEGTGALRRAAGPRGGRRDAARDGDVRRGRRLGPGGVMPDSAAPGARHAHRSCACRRRGWSTGVRRGGAMLLAPLVGALLALVGAVGVLAVRLCPARTPHPHRGDARGRRWPSSRSPCLTRGLHLDGLADTADGLGVKGTTTASASGARGDAQPDIGAFGASPSCWCCSCRSLALTSLRPRGPWHGRSLVVAAWSPGWRSCGRARRSRGSARPDGLGAAVAGRCRAPRPRC